MKNHTLTKSEMQLMNILWEMPRGGSVNSNKWFTADGRQLEGKPTKPGFYIRNGKKVILK